MGDLPDTGAYAPDLSGLVRDYGSIDAEARAARTDAALFDFSFMCRARLEGPGCVAGLNRFQGRPVDTLQPGRIAYALRLNETGNVRSDLTIWNLGGGRFEVFSGAPGDIVDLARSNPAAAVMEDLSATTAVFSLQGPRTPELTATLCRGGLDKLPYFGCRQSYVAGIPCLVGRLGYTGEKGIEVIADRAVAGELWQRLARHARPAGFGAVDRLRIEAGFILFTNECSLPVRPVELGLERFAPGDADSPRVRLVCFRAEAELDSEPWQPPRPCRPPEPGGITITSACRTACAGSVVGLGFVPAGEAVDGHVSVDRYAGFGTVTQVPLPLYDPTKQRPRGPWRTTGTGFPAPPPIKPGPQRN